VKEPRTAPRRQRTGALAIACHDWKHFAGKRSPTTRAFPPYVAQRGASARLAGQEERCHHGVPRLLPHRALLARLHCGHAVQTGTATPCQQTPQAVQACVAVVLLSICRTVSALHLGDATGRPLGVERLCMGVVIGCKVVYTRSRRGQRRHKDVKRSTPFPHRSRSQGRTRRRRHRLGHTRSLPGSSAGCATHPWRLEDRVVALAASADREVDEDELTPQDHCGAGMPDDVCGHCHSRRRCVIDIMGAPTR
jgi:hypothetical protein